MIILVDALMLGVAIALILQQKPISIEKLGSEVQNLINLMLLLVSRLVRAKPFY